jgi:hypothetical protein
MTKDGTPNTPVCSALAPNVPKNRSNRLETIARGNRQAQRLDRVERMLFGKFWRNTIALRR